MLGLLTLARFSKPPMLVMPPGMCGASSVSSPVQSGAVPAATPPAMGRPSQEVGTMFDARTQPNEDGSWEAFCCMPLAAATGAGSWQTRDGGQLLGVRHVRQVVAAVGELGLLHGLRRGVHGQLLPAGDVEQAGLSGGAAVEEHQRRACTGSSRSSSGPHAASCWNGPRDVVATPFITSP